MNKEIIVNCESYYLKQYNDQYIIEDIDGYAIIAVPDNNIEIATAILKNHIDFCIAHEII